MINLTKNHIACQFSVRGEEITSRDPAVLVDYHKRMVADTTAKHIGKSLVWDEDKTFRMSETVFTSEVFFFSREELQKLIHAVEAGDSVGFE